MTVGGMGFIPERLLMMMMMNVLVNQIFNNELFYWDPNYDMKLFVVGGLGFEFCIRSSAGGMLCCVAFFQYPETCHPNSAP